MCRNDGPVCLFVRPLRAAVSGLVVNDQESRSISSSISRQRQLALRLLHKSSRGAKKVCKVRLGKERERERDLDNRFSRI